MNLFVCPVHACLWFCKAEPPAVPYAALIRTPGWCAARSLGLAPCACPVSLIVDLVGSLPDMPQATPASTFALITVKTMGTLAAACAAAGVPIFPGQGYYEVITVGLQ